MTIIITGGGSGIGAASARRLASWSPVVIADRNMAAANEVAAEINSTGGKAIAAEVDVSSASSIRAMMTFLETRAGPIEGLFNNAGINIRQPIDDIVEADWDAVINTHVKGVLLVSQAVLPQMLARRRGVIVNTASDYAIIGVPGLMAYCAAKTAIYSLTKAMAVEFTAQGVRVNAVGPGPIDTPLLRAGRAPADAEARLAMHRAKIPMKRLGRPEEVAAVVDFLMSDRSSYIAGQIVNPNGGLVMW
jgi:NAD(P)-dependent dehydrogenase (short-subunit alcohol dehydrogenase family)